MDRILLLLRGSDCRDIVVSVVYRIQDGENRETELIGSGLVFAFSVPIIASLTLSTSVFLSSYHCTSNYV